MESSCVYEQKTVINELRLGIQMAKELRLHLNSFEARQFFIQKILSSYDNALFLLKSGDASEQPRASTRPKTSLDESSMPIGSGEVEFDQQGQNAVSKKRKGLTTLEDQAEITNKRKNVQWAALPPSPPKKYESRPTDNNHNNQLSPPYIDDLISNIDTDIVPSLYSFFPSSPFGFMEYCPQLNFPDHFDEELLNYFTESGCSPSLE